MNDEMEDLTNKQYEMSNLTKKQYEELVGNLNVKYFTLEFEDIFDE
jgi:signal-transduction protein with cAMP-binding, CBS, and nucleotidyltransferase domain